MSIRLASFALALVVILSAAAFAQDANFYLKPNDRVVFFGDSITEQAFYTNYVETYVVTRFPRLNIGFVNSGWAGDRIYGGGGGTADERLARDVFALNPTVVTLMFGMNDGCYMEFNEDCFKAFREGYEHDLQAIKTKLPAARLTLLQPSPFDDWTGSHAWRLAPPIKGGYNPVIVRFGGYVKDLAQKNQLATADMNAPLTELIQRALTSDPELSQSIVPDRIHPGAGGGLLMASALLKTWNAPSLVTSVEINGRAGKTLRSENTTVTDVNAVKSVSWTQLDGALPLPIDLKDKTIALVVKLGGIADGLDRETLKVSGLSANKYSLTIDGGNVGSFSAAELNAGVNLALLVTPMSKQAAAVHALTEEHNKLHFTRWREVQVPFDGRQFTDAPAALKSLDALEAELIKRQRLLAVPKPHHFELTPVP